MKVTLIAGARPNFMKIAPIIRAINQKRREKIYRTDWFIPVNIMTIN